MSGGHQLEIGQRISECGKAMAYCRHKNKLNATKRIDEQQNVLDLALTSSSPIRDSIPGIART